MKLHLVAGMALALAGCSQTPKDADARFALTSNIQTQAGDTSFSIDGFSKTNGQKFEVNGVEGYRYFFNASVSFPDGFHPECAKEGFAGFTCGLQFNNPSLSLRPIPRRMTVDYSGTITLEKTERGWMTDGVSMRETNRTAGPDDTQQRLANDPTYLNGSNWPPTQPGTELMFEASNAISKTAAADLTNLWPKYLNTAGVTSYTIDWNSPNRIVLCFAGGSDPESVKSTLMSSTPSAMDLHVVMEDVTPSPSSSCRT